MINKNVIERLKKGDWFIECLQISEINLVMESLSNADLKWCNGKNCEPYSSTKCVNFDRVIIMCRLPSGGIKHSDFVGLSGDDELEDITEWFFKNVNGDEVERDHLHNILNAWLDGEEIESSCFEGCWINQTETLEGELTFKKGNKYRVKQKATSLPIPDELWKLIDKKYIKAVIDKNLEVISFFDGCKIEILKTDLDWFSFDEDRNCMTIYASDFNINTDGIDWRLSLTERPSEFNYEL